MNVTLVPWIFNEATLSQTESPRGRDLVLPLGMLSIGAVLEDIGMEVELTDVNLLVDDEFDYELLAERILEKQDSDVYCFSTAAGIFHHTVQISRLIDERRPESTIVFGGPHASVVDEAVMTNFPWVDVIVRGEGEATVEELCLALKNGSPLSEVDGITYRDEGRIVSTDERPLITSVDELPTPAFHLYPNDLVQEKNIDLRVAVEVGRGCPYQCTYCSTSVYWERHFRAKSPDRIVEEMRAATDVYDVDHITLRHDNFLVDRERVLAFCDAFSESDLDVTWSCSGRIDTVDPELLNTMGASGCSAIEFGVESGSERMQRQIKKNLSLSALTETLQWCNDAGIRTELYFMCGFPDETREDLEQTMQTIVDSFLASTYNNYSQLLVLYPFPETEVRRKNEELLTFYPERTLSDTAELYTDELLSLAERSPELFPELYVLENRHGIPPETFFDIERLMWFVFQYLMINYRWTLYVLLDRLSNDFFEFHDVFLDYFGDVNRHSHEALLDEFPAFVEHVADSRDVSFPDYLLDLFEYEDACNDLRDSSAAGTSGTHDDEVPRGFQVANDVDVRTFDYDVPRIISELTDGQTPADVPENETTMILGTAGSERVKTYKIGELDRRILAACETPTGLGELNRRLVQRFDHSPTTVTDRVSRLTELGLIEVAL